MTSVIIINAGLSKRMQDVYPGIPKALIVPSGGMSILEFQLLSLNRFEEMIERIIIVVGYEEQMFRKFIEHFDTPFKRRIHFVSNQDYASTDNAYSLALALNAFKKMSDVIVIDGDVVYEPELLGELIRSDRHNYLVGRTTTNLSSEDAKVLVENGFVKGVGKDIPGTYLYCSLARFCGKFLDYFREELNKEEWMRTWYSVSLTSLLKKHRKTVLLLDAQGQYTADVDFPEELEEVADKMRQMLRAS